ncbi:MAG TPA: hypothetical protein VFS44_00280 [Gemmatimonadaceae bacterium]|nr:hypothetical protein [Gemmatimonadaceae bacterium]
MLLMIATLRPAPAHAQTNADSTYIRRECRLASRIIATGHPAPHERWAEGFITNCGREGGAAIAAGMRALRTETDIAALSRQTIHAHILRDSSVFAVAMEIAADRGASIPARVFAFRSLLFLLKPDRQVSYRDLTGGFDEIGAPRATCAVGSYIADQLQLEGAPLPADYASRIHALGRRIFDDHTEPTDVRTAAGCVP